MLGIPEGRGIIFAIVYYGIGVIILAMIIRMLLSWLVFFGLNVDERYAIVRFLYKLTDPFIDPIRRIVPRVGFIDLSFFIAWFLLGTMQILLSQALPFGW